MSEEIAAASEEEKISAIESALSPEPTPEPVESEAAELETSVEPTESESETPEPVAATKPDPIEQVEIDPDLITRAVRAGIDYQDVKHFPSNGALARTVEHFERLQRGSEPEKSPEDELKLPPKLDPTKYSEEEIERDNALRNVLIEQHKMLKGMRDQQSMLTQNEHQKAIIDRATWFDAKIKAQGGDFEPELGRGGWRDGKLSGQARATREKLWAMTDLMEQNFGMDRETAFDGALRALLGAKYDRTAVAKVKGELKTRSQTRTFPGAGTKKMDALPVDDLSKDPSIKEAWNKIKEETGTR